MTGFRIEILRSGHDRSSFSCGLEPLDRYLKQQANQDVRRRVASCFVAVEEGSDRLAGFYTLAATGVPLIDIPERLVERFASPDSLAVETGAGLPKQKLY